MMQEYLEIARQFNAGYSSTQPENHSTSIGESSTPDTQAQNYEPCEKSEISASVPGIAQALAAESEVAQVYETKSTIPGGKPPLQKVQERQAWLATIDWSQGLRCGLSNRQCRVCKGIPCHDSTEWRP